MKCRTLLKSFLATPLLWPRLYRQILSKQVPSGKQLSKTYGGHLIQTTTAIMWVLETEPRSSGFLN